MVPLEFSSRTGKSLLERARRIAGNWTVRTVPRFERLFRLVSPFAPGLAFVGGQLSATPFDPVTRSSLRLSVGGTATSVAAALVSCLGEGLERLSQVERRGDADPYRPAAKGRVGIDETIADWLDRSFGDIATSDRRSLDWRTVVELSTGRRSMVPADLCLRRSEGRRRLPLLWPLSIGCAAGATSDQAAARAILELVERDAVALWWRGGRRGRPVAPDGPVARSATRLLGRLRSGQGFRSTRLLDITTDLEIPALAALSTNPDGRGLAVGFACRPSAIEAARAAILEMTQVETAFALIGAKLAEGGSAALDETDRRQLRLGEFDAAGSPLCIPAGRPRSWTGKPVGGGAAQDFASHLRSKGIEVWLNDLTRHDLGIAVVQAVALRLQPYPSALRGDRLLSTIAIHGGGDQYSAGIEID
ncbi:MAG: YcaO-like family protein [Reyranella sp.]|uniref:YcaO-like family protein n=1 Tax=Reyranella sp. TaxID=1929291 RepID=UPI003D0A07D1